MVDISTPSIPQHVGSLDSLFNPQAIELAGGLADVADEDEGLKILDVGTPAAPTVIGSFDTGGKAKDVHVEGAKAYVAGDEGGFPIFSLTPCAGIFASGIETGNTDDWDATVP